MKTVNIHAAKTHLSSLVEEAARGILKGKVWISDDFDDPLPPEILRGFGIEP